MNTNVDELEKSLKELNEIEKIILDDHTKETAKELNNFIKIKQKVAILSAKKKSNKHKEAFYNKMIKKT